MRVIFFLIIVLFNFSSINLVGQSWQWAKTAGGGQIDSGLGIFVDANSNTYITGSYQSPTITFGATTFTNAGAIDMFVVKYDPNGNVVWAKTAGGASFDNGLNITADSSGNVYVAVSSYNSSLTIGNTTLALQGLFDIVIIKYDPNGNVLWATSAGGTGDDIAQSISVDASQNLYITGYFRSSSIIFGSDTLSNSGSNDFYIAKYSSNGSVQWAKKAVGTLIDAATGIVTDALGNSYVTGSFTSPSISFGNNVLMNSGGKDLFIAKYDGAGNNVWAKSAIGNSNDVGNAIKIDGLGNLYVVGTFNSATLTIDTTVLSTINFEDIFVLKCDTSGNFLWVKSAGGSAIDNATGIAVDNNGILYITGYFSSSDLLFGNTTLTNIGTNNIFIASYDASGNAVWATSIGNNGDDETKAISVSPNGSSISLCGYYSSSLISVGTTTLSNVGTYDVFVAKLGAITTDLKDSASKAFTETIIPNPNNGLFEIRINNHQYISEQAKISIMNTLGQTVFISTQVAQSTLVLLENSGVYFMTVQIGSYISTKKIIVN